MRLTRYLGYGIADQNHPVIVFDPAPHRCGHANASRHARDDTGIDAPITEDRIKRCAWREAAKAFLDDQMLAFPGLELFNDLRSPGVLDDKGAVAARRTDSNAPIRECCIGVVGLDHVRDIDHWSFG